MNDYRNRPRSIWDMNAEDTNFYLIVFMTLMMPGVAYVLWFRIVYEAVPVAEQVLVMVRDIGLVGGSSAALAFAIIVMRRGIMALIDWPSKAKYRAEGRAEGRMEGRIEGRSEGRIEGRSEGRIEGRSEGRIEIQREWLSWNNRRLEAERRGEKFTEPPPGA